MSDFSNVKLYPIPKSQIQNYCLCLSGSEQERLLINNLVSNCLKRQLQPNQKEKWGFLHLNGNILLYGNPGMGKTSIVYECAMQHPKATLYNINISSLISEKLGQTEKRVSEFFDEVIVEAEQNATILLLEEIEAFLPNRTSDDLADMKRALTVFMQYLDLSLSNLVIFCTTNHKEMLDPAIIRRFSLVLEIKNDSAEAVLSFLTNENNPFSPSFSDDKCNMEIANLFTKHNLSFSQLKNYMKRIYIAEDNLCSQSLLTLLKKEYEHE